MTNSDRNVAQQRFVAVPYAPTPDRYDVVSEVVRGIATQESLFTDFQRACEPICADVSKCGKCESRLRLVASMLCDPRARVWEVWDTDGIPTLAGVLYITDIVQGCDAKAHYLFFDHDLRSKTDLLRHMIQWTFEDHPEEGWIGLRRLTVEIPDYAFALARHATKSLGFGGAFRWRCGRDGSIAVEGVRESAIVWRGKPRDMLILGKVNENGNVRTSASTG